MKLVRPFLLASLALLVACKDKPKLGRRSDDAGPAVLVVDQTASGAPIVGEKEPNDDPAAAQVVVLPGGVKAVVDKAGDVDAFALDVAQPGVLSVKVSALADADLMVELTDGAGARLVLSDNGPKNTVEGVPNWLVQPGKYRVIVREFVKKPPAAKKKSRPEKKKGSPDAAPPPGGREAPSAPYVLELGLAPLPGEDEEAEPNESAAFARVLPLPGSARGFAGWRKDRDVWQVRLADVRDDEALGIDVDGVADVALRVALLDGTEAVLLERQGRPGEAVSLRNIAVRPGEPHYFVAISAQTRGNSDERYEVRATVTPLELDEETEPNDDVKRAGLLADVPSDAGTRVGYLARGDTDVYKLDPAAGPRELHVTIEPPAGVDAVLSVVDEGGAPIAPSVDAGGAGAPERLSGVIVAANATVYVKLVGKAGEGGERYRLRWSAAPAAEAAPVPGVEDEE